MGLCTVLCALRCIAQYAQTDSHTNRHEGKACTGELFVTFKWLFTREKNLFKVPSLGKGILKLENLAGAMETLIG